MDMIIKKAIVAVCVFNSLQLFAMEIESYKKSDNDSWFKNTMIFCNGMQRYNDDERIGIPKDVAVVVAQKSCLLRQKEVYTKFDSFFRFNNDDYYKIKSDWDKKRMEFIDENPDMSDDDIERFNKLYPYNIHLCRKFCIIEPNDLLFFTKKQDTILSLLLLEPRLKPFHHNKGSFSLQLNEEDNEQYEMLPNEFKKKIEGKYPKFVFPKQSHEKSVSYQKFDFDEIF
jgi:hypothetical protein